MRVNLLFVCSRNQWRSPTAEVVCNKLPGVQARSAGTASAARVRVSEELLLWADIVFAMEHKHKQVLQAQFATAMQGKKVVVLDIPDEYTYMDDELVLMIEDSVLPYLPQ